MNDIPVPKVDPPVGKEYQLIVPELAVTLKSTVPELHLSPFVTDKIVGVPFTVTVLVDVADEQPPEPVFV